LNLSYNNFIRTTDPHHIHAAQEFWLKSKANDDIYKKNYKSKYCVGCELEKTDSELVDGKCPLHPNREIEIIEEENYFFRFSKYQDKLLEMYDKDPNFVVPNAKYNEIKEFVKSGLQDFSISRLKKKMPWGVEVPNDPDHVMYVWFDALINYISALGWPENQKQFDYFWPGIQCAGKDNLRQQTAIWQAMLLSAGLPPSKQIFIHGFISVDGQKISKSLGNTVDPYTLVNTYGTDALRYYLLAEIPSYNDGDFSERRFKELYNADLANGLGNLVARVAKLATNLRFKIYDLRFTNEIKTEYKKAFEEFRFHDALAGVWELIKQADTYIDQKTPWKLEGRELEDVLIPAIDTIRTIATLLQPFLPETAEKILTQFQGPTTQSQPPLFPRIT